MKLFAVLALAAILSGCSLGPSQPYHFTELVLAPGDEVTAATRGGTIKVHADGALQRTYTWEGASRTSILRPRRARRDGSLGAYDTASGHPWRDHKGVTRGVIEEGQQHFANERQALAWINQPWHRGSAVYNNEGLYILFSKSPDRSQINVDIFQIYIGGKKPATLTGANDGAVSLRRAGITHPVPSAQILQ